MNLANGFGKILAVTTTAQRVAFDTMARNVTIYNRGTEAVAVNVNLDATAAFDAIYAAGGSIRIEAGQAFTFEYEVPAIDSICVRVDNTGGTATVNLGAY